MIIAEIAQAHEGSLGIAHSYIDSLTAAGVDAIKFQTHIAIAESSEKEQFRVNFSHEDNTRFDYWKRMEFSEEQWIGLKKHCDKNGVEFISSPFSVTAVNLLERIGVKRYKIGSGEMTNYLMLYTIAQTRKPIILSSGMSDWGELDATIKYLKPFGNDLSLMQCTTAYPTIPEQWGLSILSKMRERYNLPIGFSDHSSSIYACLAAAALGATIFEFHAVFDKNMFGPDSKASLTINEISSLVKGIKMIQKALTSNDIKNDTSQYQTLKSIFGKSLAVNKELKKGHRIQIEDLESKKPGDQGIKAIDFENIIGRKLIMDIPQWSFLKPEFFE